MALSIVRILPQLQSFGVLQVVSGSVHRALSRVVRILNVHSDAKLLQIRVMVGISSDGVVMEPRFLPKLLSACSVLPTIPKVSSPVERR